MSQSTSIRPAKPADHAALSVVQLEAWRDAYQAVFPVEFLEGLAVPEERWASRIRDGATIDVAVDGGTVVGYCSYSPADEPGWGEIRAIYIRPAWQGMGHGTRLLESALAALSARFEKALLWVIDRNERARRFYEGGGWSLGAPFRLETIGETDVTLVRYEIDLRGSHSRW